MLANLPTPELHAFWDAGDIGCKGDELEQAQARLAEKVAYILKAGARPVVLGGGHEVAWGSFQGLAAHLAAEGRKPSILIVNLRSEEHTSELQSLMRISYPVFCSKKKTQTIHQHIHTQH